MPILSGLTKPCSISFSYALVLFLASYLPQYISQIAPAFPALKTTEISTTAVHLYP